MLCIPLTQEVKGTQRFCIALCADGTGQVDTLAIFGVSVKFRIERVEVSGIQSVLNNSQALAESLEMNDFPGTQEADRVADFRVFDKS